MRLLLFCVLMTLLTTLGMAQVSADPSAAAAEREEFWVSAGYGIPNSFMIGAGLHDIFLPDVNLDLQVAVLDKGVRFDIMAMYYADTLIDLPPLLSLYAALGPSLLVSSAVDVGISAKVGVEYRLKVIDFEPMAAFIEVQPRAHIIPSTQFSLSAALGLRVHF